MGVLSNDAYEVQNPALTAVMQWRFSVGYQNARNDAAGPPLQLAFLVAPLLLYPETYALLKSTQRTSGLRVFAEKFARSKVNQNDILLALNHRTRLFRNLSIRGIQLAISSGLLTVRRESAQLLPLSRTKPVLDRSEASSLLRASEKLGGWMGELTLHEISFILKVSF